MKNMSIKKVFTALCLILTGCCAEVESECPNHLKKFPTTEEFGLLAQNIDLPSADQEEHHFYSELKQLFPECDEFFIQEPGITEHPIYYGRYEKDRTTADTKLKCSFYTQDDCKE